MSPTRDRNRVSPLVTFTAILVPLTLLLVCPVKAQTFSVIYNFTGSGDGAAPVAGVTVDASGNLYCTASMGGTYNRGTVCKLNRQGSGWIFKDLYNFAAGSDGSTPLSRAVIGPEGAIYGTTEFGGRDCGVGCGTVYRLQPPLNPCHSIICPWNETVLYKFVGEGDGANPGYGDVSFDSSGNMYGTTSAGGSSADGVVFQLTRSGNNWTEAAILAFNGGDGKNPWSGVTFDGSGNLFGTTSSGGARSYGTVYKLTTSGSGWTESTLYSFQGSSDGGNPFGGVILDSSGNLYGGTSSGGAGSGGTIYELTYSGGWDFNLLNSLAGSAYEPGVYGNLTRDAAGNLYGTTQSEGASGQGSVFKLSPSGGSWVYTSLHDFTGGSDGGNPVGGVSFDANGNLYGTAKSGGAHSDGVIWEITP